MISYYSICDTCKGKHFGKCKGCCNFCKIPGHREEDCRKKKAITCYNYGEAGHYRTNCPKLGNPANEKARPAEGTTKRNARAFQLTTQEAELIPDILVGTF